MDYVGTGIEMNLSLPGRFYLIVYNCFLASILFLSSCNDEDYVGISYSLEYQNGIYPASGDVSFDVRLTDSYEVSSDMYLTCEFSTDDHQQIDKLSYPLSVTSGSDILQRIVFTPPGPGIYNVKVQLKGSDTRSNKLDFNIGFDPEKIVSLADAKSDFDDFWQCTREELDKVSPEYQLTYLDKYSTGNKNTYLVKMKSWDNAEIAGYYQVPKTGGNFPVIIGFMGYGGNDEVPDPNADPGVATFILSVRGQGIQKPENSYGQWILYGLESKDTYYYRGAYMDLIRSVDFMVSRKEVDNSRILVSGGSQGGGFAIVASALDKRIAGCLCSFVFLSDFENSFNKARWPKSQFIMYKEKHPRVSWSNIYDVLSYFDVKNFASKVSCPLLMCITLHDDICPPCSQFAAYNLVQADKQYIVCPDCGHEWKYENDPQVIADFKSRILFPAND